MRFKGHAGLSPLSSTLRGIVTSSIANQVPALASQRSSGGGILSWVFGGHARVTTPLTDPLPDVHDVTPAPVPDAPPNTQITRLDNGVTVASQNLYSPSASLGIYAAVGSVYETSTSTGATHLLEYNAFKGTEHRSHFRIVRETENIGAQAIAHAARETMAFTMDVVRPNVAAAAEILCDAVVNPKFEEYLVEDQLNKLKKDIDRTFTANPLAKLSENINTVAYTGSLANPLVCPKEAHLTAEVLHEFHTTHFTAPRLVLACAGVEHEQLVQLANEYLGHLPRTSVPSAPASQYVGGVYSERLAGPMSHAILAFECPGWKNVKGSTLATVMSYLMGGGGSFSAGGPGKGMHSRLYTRVLNRYQWVENCSTFSMIYDGSGLFGISCSALAQQTGPMIDLLCGELQALTGGVTQEELDRAKNATISAVLMALENNGVAAEDIGRQTLTYGSRKAPAEFIEIIKSITNQDIKNAAAAMLKTPPTLAMAGELSQMPRYDNIVRRFG